MLKKYPIKNGKMKLLTFSGYKIYSKFYILLHIK
jgi:hypothetical protein